MTLSPVLSVPALSNEEPAAGRRVVATTKEWQGSEAHHTLYLPEDWKLGASLPVIVEYAGNGDYKNKFGDVSEGTVEGCIRGMVLG